MMNSKRRLFIILTALTLLALLIVIHVPTKHQRPIATPVKIQKDLKNINITLLQSISVDDKPPDQDEGVKLEKDANDRNVDSHLKQVLVKSNENVTFNNVSSEDVMPGYFDLAADLVPQYEKYLDDTRKNMEGRVANIKRHCKIKKLENTTGQDNLYYFPDQDVTWCPVHKAGSTNWKYFFCSQYLPEVYEEHVRKPWVDVPGWMGVMGLLQPYKITLKNSKDRAERIGSSVKFLTARHPYERLVSAYREKFENCRDGRYHEHTMSILRKYREVPSSTNPAVRNQLLEAARGMCGKKTSKTVDLANPYMVPLGATFKEFIQDVVDGYLNNGIIWSPDLHWSPITKACELCTVEYDVIEKFETLERDHHYLLHVMGRPELLPMIAGSHTNARTKSSVDVKKYLETLDNNLLLNLYTVYKDDFDMFGYKPHMSN